MRTVEIRPAEDAYVAADGEPQMRLPAGDVIRVGVASFHTLIASITDHDFYQVLRAKLQWGAAKPEPSS